MLSSQPVSSLQSDEVEEDVILVDLADRVVGSAEKLRAHRLGYLHRAISVCVLDPSGRMLLQRRAEGKYHSPRLWTNACCTHPRPGESVRKAAERRLLEELGISCPLSWLFTTHYKAQMPNTLIENELVHVFVGQYTGSIQLNPLEVEDFCWRTREDIDRAIDQKPANFTYWFKHYIASYGDSIFGPPVEGAAVRDPPLFKGQ